METFCTLSRHLSLTIFRLPLSQFENNRYSPLDVAEIREIGARLANRRAQFDVAEGAQCGDESRQQPDYEREAHLKKGEMLFFTDSNTQNSLHFVIQAVFCC